ncbi:MAG: endonuclease [Thioalkalivibrio sp.]|nr:MAG: endonuclease [Thioalkalivibrio sp.]
MHWWPADSVFEVVVGAVLTQNTRWQNVERAIANLREAGRLDPDGILALPESELAALIRPSGYFNVKARRLASLVRFIRGSGGLETLAGWDTPRLRTALLEVHGIGPETADDILLYAFGRPVFVVDAYTRRLFARLGWFAERAPYEELRLHVEAELGADAGALNELHALIVEHGKRHCRPRPSCNGCALREICTVGG